MRVNQIWRLVFAFVLALALGLPAQAQESRLDVVVKRDKLIVATYSTAPPLAFTDEKGQLVGFEIDLARLIAKDLLGDPNKIEFMIVQSRGGSRPCYRGGRTLPSQRRLSIRNVRLR
jgi:polar amino acid transport system substrate-binding protein